MIPLLKQNSLNSSLSPEIFPIAQVACKKSMFE